MKARQYVTPETLTADNGNVFLWFQDLASPFTWSVSRPAEVQPWEVRFAHTKNHNQKI